MRRHLAAAAAIAAGALTLSASPAGADTYPALATREFTFNFRSSTLNRDVSCDIYIELEHWDQWLAAPK